MSDNKDQGAAPASFTPTNVPVDSDEEDHEPLASVSSLETVVDPEVFIPQQYAYEPSHVCYYYDEVSSYFLHPLAHCSPASRLAFAWV